MHVLHRLLLALWYTEIMLAVTGNENPSPLQISRNTRNPSLDKPFHGGVLL